MADTFLGTAAPLTKTAVDQAVHDLRSDEPSLWALLSVETLGFGFLVDRRPKILFERHIFHKRTAGRFAATHPDVSSLERGGYQGGALEYPRLEQAMQLDRRAALESTSWGLPQIMGFNASVVRYRDVDEMVAKFRDGEDAQLAAGVQFILHNDALASAFRNKRWATVAFYYNGQDYAKKGYHLQLERAHALYEATAVPDVEVRAAQARLTYLGYSLGNVDGVVGNRTKAATLAFQNARRLPVTADLDEATRQELKVAARV